MTDIKTSNAKLEDIRRRIDALPSSVATKDALYHTFSGQTTAGLLYDIYNDGIRVFTLPTTSANFKNTITASPNTQAISSHITSDNFNAVSFAGVSNNDKDEIHLEAEVAGTWFHIKKVLPHTTSGEFLLEHYPATYRFYRITQTDTHNTANFSINVFYGRR